MEYFLDKKDNNMNNDNSSILDGIFNFAEMSVAMGRAVYGIPVIRSKVNPFTCLHSSVANLSIKSGYETISLKSK